MAEKHNTSCLQCNKAFGILFNRSSKCPACYRAICSACVSHEMSHPNFPTKRVEVCEKCFRETLLARDGQHVETVPGPVANTMMLRFANLLLGSFYEVTPGQPIKVHRNSFVMRNLPTAKPATVGGWQSEDITVPIDDTVNIMMRWYHPAPFDPKVPMGALVYYHGGGWTAGSVFQKDQDTNYRNFCKAFGLMFFAVEYRLSPENPFPIPFEDSYAAYKYVVANAEKLGVDASKLVTIGDSAGANLSVGVALAALERGITPPAYIVGSNGLYYCDKYNQYPSCTALASMNPCDAIDGMVLGCTPNAGDRKDYRCSPAYAKPELLSKLPPTMITVAGYDALKDENLEFIQALRTAGVHVTSTVASISWHGFFPAFAEGQEILHQAAYLVKRQFGLLHVPDQ
eukprot:TRINITY_DN1736_c0_g1_i1.p1 TRINITY_DN1736_c0_g1~~TRINITY_DN1736_c0_g1_i1.p1  ORF type:complete len:400 (-),score=41.77 TRINITY_DN1736_c0_g1_i1:139-1338(-)